LTYSYNEEELCIINGVDVSNFLMKIEFEGNNKNAVMTGTSTFGKRGLESLISVQNSMPVQLLRRYTVTENADTPYMVQRQIFDGFITGTPEEGRGKITFRIDDKLSLLLRSDINKRYGYPWLLVDLAEIVYDILTTAGVRCTYGEDDATIQTSGITTDGILFAHKNAMAAVTQIRDALGWQIYYDPDAEMAYFEPMGYQSSGVTLSNGDWSGPSQWNDDASAATMCNSITIVPGPSDNVETFTQVLKTNIDTSAQYGWALNFGSKALQYKTVVGGKWVSGGGGGIAAGTEHILKWNVRPSPDPGYLTFVQTPQDIDMVVLFPSNGTSSNIQVNLINNTYLGTTSLNDFYAGDKIVLDMGWNGPSPQSYKDDESINRYGLFHKTITRGDLSPGEALRFAQSYVDWFKDPLIQFTPKLVHDPRKFIRVGQKVNVDDSPNGRTATDLVVVSYKYSWPKKYDEVVLGELQALTADFTTGLDDRIKNLETSNQNKDYTQGNYIPLGYTGGGGSGGGTGSTDYDITASSALAKLDGTASTNTTANPSMRKTVYAATRIWLFYGGLSGKQMVISSGDGGNTWDHETEIIASGSAYNDFAIVSDGTNFHYVFGANTGTLYYRMGQFNADGTITWKAAQNSAGNGGTTCYLQSVRFDSNLAVLYTYRRDNQIWVNRMSKPTDGHTGTWASDSGWPKQITDNGEDSANWRSSLEMLSGGKWVVLYGQATARVKAKYWDGSALSAYEYASLSNIESGPFFTTASDGTDKFHFAYLKVSPYRMMYRCRNANGIWDTSEIDLTGADVNSQCVPHLGVDDKGRVYAVWVNGDHIYYTTIKDGTKATNVDAYTMPDPMGSEYAANMTSYMQSNKTFLMGYYTGSAANYEIRLFKLALTGGTGTGGGTGGGTPNATGLVAVANGVLVGPTGVRLNLRGVNDTWTLPGFIGARGGNFNPDSSGESPVNNHGAVISSNDGLLIESYFEDYGKALKTAGYTYVRIGAKDHIGLDYMYTTWRYDVANSTGYCLGTILAMANGLKAAGIYFTIVLGGFNNTPVANRTLATTMVNRNDYINAATSLTNNILHKGSTSQNNYADFAIAVGDEVGDNPYLVSIELFNEPDNSAYMTAYWQAQYGTNMTTGGAVMTAYKESMKAIVERIKQNRTVDTWLISNGPEPLAGPPYWDGATSGDITAPANLIVNLSESFDIVSTHLYHFSPIWCDATNTGTCDGSTCGWNRILAAINNAAKAAGKPLIIDEFGRYCDSAASAAAYEAAHVTSLDSLAIPWVAVYGPSKPSIAVDTPDPGGDTPGVGDVEPPSNRPFSHYIKQDFKVYGSDTTTLLQNTGSFLDAVNWAQGQSSCTAIKIAPGNYPLSSRLNIRKSMFGSGMSGSNKTRIYASSPSYTDTMIRLSAASPAYTNLLQGVVLSFFELDGMKDSGLTGKLYGGIQGQFTKNCTIDHVIVHHCPRKHGIQLQSGYYCIISNCIVHDIGTSTVLGAYGNGICSGEMFRPGNGSQSVADYPCAYNTVDNCEVYGCSMNCQNWEPGHHNTVKNCYFHNMNQKFIDTDGSTKYARVVTTYGKSDATAMHGNVYDNCEIHHQGIGMSLWDGDHEVKNCTFYADTTDSMAEYGGTWMIYMDKHSYGVKGRVNFHDNTIQIKGSSGVGIKVQQASGGTISNNDITTLTGNGIGIQLGSATSGITGTGNTMSGGGTKVQNSGSGNNVS
jgi:hypothetical protein